MSIRGAKNKYRCDKCKIIGGFCDIVDAPPGSKYESLCKACFNQEIKNLKKAGWTVQPEKFSKEKNKEETAFLCAS
jgi:hypothetical protein